MTANQPLDRNVRWVLIVIVVLIVAVPMLAVRHYIASVTTQTVAANEPADERLVSIGKSTMLLEPGGLGAAISDWVNLSKEQTFEFELSDRSFAAGSPELSRIGKTRVSQVLPLIKTHPTVTVRILLPTQAAVNLRALNESRAARLRNELVVHGIDASRVTMAGKTDDLPTAKSTQMAVLLTK